MSETTNLRVLKASRSKPNLGDVFVMQLPNKEFLFGRVISTTAAIGPMKDVLLIYIFRTRARRPVLPNRAVLSSDSLLIAPILTNLLPWRKGYFMTIDSLPFAKGEVLARHCFLWEWRDRTHFRRYFDESNNELPGPVEPVGIHGLHSYLTIDDEISKALGFPVGASKPEQSSVAHQGDGTTSREIRIVPRDDDELERLLRLENELMDAGIVWDAGYSSEIPGRIWRIDIGKGSSLDEILSRVRKEGLHPHMD